MPKKQKTLEYATKLDKNEGAEMSKQKEKYTLELTEKQLKSLLSCLVFSSSTDACWDDPVKHRDTHKKLLKKFIKLGIKCDPDIYIYDGVQEDQDLNSYMIKHKIVNYRK